jgi:UDP-glucose 4-epimerase
VSTCVIGGTGFIGRYLVACLVASGRDVCVIGRRHAEELRIPEGASYSSCDANNIIQLKSLLLGHSEIVDLSYATVPKTSFDDPLYDLEANLPHSVKLFEIAKQLPDLEQLVVVSSGGTVYGEVQSVPIAETTPTNPISPYGITKLAIERYAQMYFRLFDLPAIVVRPANAYGIGQRDGTGQGFIAAAIARVRRGEKVTVYGQNGTIRDYIHVHDIAEGILSVLNRGTAGEVYNIGTGVGHSNREVLELIEPLAKAGGRILNIEFLASRNFDVPMNVLSSEKLCEHTGWQPKISLPRGISEIWEAIS